LKSARCARARGQANSGESVVSLLTNGDFIGGKDSVRLFLKPFERASFYGGSYPINQSQKLTEVL
jgi:hypothetical protein